MEGGEHRARSQNKLGGSYVKKPEGVELVYHASESSNDIVATSSPGNMDSGVFVGSVSSVSKVSMPCPLSLLGTVWLAQSTC